MLRIAPSQPPVLIFAAPQCTRSRGAKSVYNFDESGQSFAPQVIGAFSYFRL